MKNPTGTPLRAPVCGRLLTGLLVLSASVNVFACQAAPLQRPLNRSSIAAGPETIESIRRELEGQWNLISLNVTNEAGVSTPVGAGGVLLFDAYGNLDIEYRLTDEGLKSLAGIGITPATNVLSTKGRVTIDPQNHTIAYVTPEAHKNPLDPELAQRRANPFAVERIRYYTLEAGALKVATRYENGRDAAVGRWKKG